VDWDETLERVRSAAEFCASSGLTRFRIDEKELEIDVRRVARSERVTQAVPPPGAAVVANHGPSNGSRARDDQKKTLKAEFVGIVRFSRPTVAEGTLVGTDRELAYVESLGIRNPVRSGGPCRIAEIFVSDGQPVGFGQPLLAIEPQDV
jgi:acetyl-CoA carboxylase biotin carboxyl carrier protein